MAPVDAEEAKETLFREVSDAVKAVGLDCLVVLQVAISPRSQLINGPCINPSRVEPLGAEAIPR